MELVLDPIGNLNLFLELSHLLLELFELGQLVLNLRLLHHFSFLIFVYLLSCSSPLRRRFHQERGFSFRHAHGGALLEDLRYLRVHVNQHLLLLLELLVSLVDPVVYPIVEPGPDYRVDDVAQILARELLDLLFDG